MLKNTQCDSFHDFQCDHFFHICMHALIVFIDFTSKDLKETNEDIN